MSEVTQLENDSAEATEKPPEEAAQPQTETEAQPLQRIAAEKRQKSKKKRAKRIKRIITLIVVLAILGGIAFGLYWLLREEDEPENVAKTEFIYRGSIQSMVTGAGRASPKESETITLTTGGTVLEVYVKDGDFVNEGDPLYVIDSTTALKAVEDAQKTVTNYEKQLSAVIKSYDDLEVRAGYAGTLVGTADIRPGDAVTTGTKLGTLVDDSRLKLELYFSYAYEYMIAPGQTAAVSIPAVMGEVDGTVTEVNYVRRITPEGAALFQAIIELNNPGTLTEKMGASATLFGDEGELIFPYDAGELTYSRRTDILTKTGGTALSVNLLEYSRVEAGQLLLLMDSEGSDESVAALENQIKTAMETLERAQQNLENFAPVAPMTGTVLSCALVAGDTVTSGSVAITIANTAEMIVEARINEMNIAYVKPGMYCDVTYESRNESMMFTGVVESVSLEIKFADGLSYFPARIIIDNQDAALMPNVEVYYSMMASQSDGCLIAPMQAVKYTGEGVCLFVRLDERPENALDTEAMGIEVPEGFYAVPVNIGISDEYSVEIIDGVEEGAEVFTQLAPSDEMGRMGGGIYIG